MEDLMQEERLEVDPLAQDMLLPQEEGAALVMVLQQQELFQPGRVLIPQVVLMVEAPAMDLLELQQLLRRALVIMLLGVD